MATAAPSKWVSGWIVLLKKGLIPNLKRRKINSNNNNASTIEILRGDDNGEEFSGFEESDYESVDEIDDSEWKAGCRQVLREFGQFLSGIRTNELPN